jgi:hypothetical protein
MASDTRDPQGDWLIQVCPGCGDKVCVPAAGAARPGRCPRCNVNLTPPAPVAPRPTAIRVVRPGKHTPPPPPDEADEPLEDRYDPARLVRRRRPPRPEAGAASLWQGTFSFPWLPSNVRAWILFGVGFSLTAFMGAVVRHTTLLYQEAPEFGQNIYFRALILFWKGVVLFFLWTGFYAGGYFLATVQDTASGQDKTAWPQDTIGEKLLTLLYLIWVAAFAAVPAAPLVMALRYALDRASQAGVPFDPLVLKVGPVILVAPWVLVLTFPWFFLATQATQSLVGFWHGGLIRGLFRWPGLLAVFYLASFLLMVPCYLLWLATVFGLQYYLVPLTGFITSAAVLIYGRLLGRVGGIVSGQDIVSTRRRR